MTLISRDAFARQELHRQTATISRGSCDWCGQVRMSRHKRPVPQLYSFTIEGDGGRRNRVEGLFCSTGCMRSYHCG